PSPSPQISGVDLPSAPRKELLVNRFAIIAALPEPAYGPTHGLLSRRSTDRISTSPLANFAQLSMFRFDGLNIQNVFLSCNTKCIIGGWFCDNKLYSKVIYFFNYQCYA
ncbi:TPA: hypothetical protein ACHFPU_004693, partial [Enterobacter hormaechei]